MLIKFFIAQGGVFIFMLNLWPVPSLSYQSSVSIKQTAERSDNITSGLLQ